MEDGEKVAVIGGGYAGCAAAVTLASRGVQCVLFETGPVLGGRGRRIERDGLRLDNGQHLALGAYTATWRMLDIIGARPPMLRRPLSIVPFGTSTTDAITLRTWRAPGRLGLLGGLLSAQGLTWRERIANIAWFRALERTNFVRPRGETVARLLKPLPPRVARLLWEPLNLAALNTPAKTASSQVFANVLKASFTGRGEECDFVLPATDLSDFFPEHAARYVEERDGSVSLGTRAQVAAAEPSSATIAANGRAERASAAIVAVGPHQLERAFAKEMLAARPDLAERIAALEAHEYEPITTVWLGYRERVHMPGPIARLDDAPGQWVIERPDVLASGAATLAQMLAVVISASGPHSALPHDELARRTDAQLRRLMPSLPSLAWSFVVEEKRATYACTPERPRAGGPRLLPGVYLAGDYVDEEFPATLEAAVRSGIAAAEALLADRAR